MNFEQPYYLAKLKEDLSLRQRNNPSYSLRAYARDMGLHAGTLSQIINGKRALPVKDSRSIIKKLKLKPDEKSLFIESLYQKKSALDAIKIPTSDDRITLDDSHFKIIAEWEHFAVIELFDVKEFARTTKDIAERLCIKLNRAEVVVTNLIQAGFLEVGTDGKLLKITASLKTTDDVANSAIRIAQKDLLRMAEDRLEEVDIERRVFTDMTLAIDPEKVSEAKVLIREFKQKVAALLSQDENKSEVYTIAIQMFPVAQTKNNLH